MASHKEVIRPLFRITPLRFLFLAQLCKPIFGGLSPPQRLKASSSRALRDLCVEGHESCLLVELLLWFPVQQLWHRFTSSSARAKQGHSYRSVSLLTGDSLPQKELFAPPESSGCPTQVGVEKCFQRVWKRDAFIWLALHWHSSCTWLR